MRRMFNLKKIKDVKAECKVIICYVTKVLIPKFMLWAIICENI